MDITANEYAKQILLIANKYDEFDVFNYFINTKSRSFPELTKDIIILMFNNKFNPQQCTEIEHNAYLSIYEYQMEIIKNGYIIFI